MARHGEDFRLHLQTLGNCEKFLLMAMKRQLDVANLKAGVFPVAVLQSLQEMLPERS